MSGQLSDERLVRACLDGDAAAWETLVRRYRRLIYSIPVALRLPPDGADEVFSRVCLRLFENLAGVREVRALPSWLATVARREALGVIRESSRLDGDDEALLARRADTDPGVLSRLETVEREHAVRLALERLDEACRRLLEALYVEDPRPSYEEISARLGRPIGSLGPTRARCLKKLRRLIAPDVEI